MSVLEKDSLFPEVLVKELFDQVKGHSSLATLSGQMPISFSGNKLFTFAMDGEADYVAEGGAKTAQNTSITPKTVIPHKFVYSSRVSDEFLLASDEQRISILQSFIAGASRKFGRALDVAALHGCNPRTGNTVSVLSAGCFDTLVTNTVTATSSADADVTSAIALVEANEYDVTGMAMAPAFRTALASMKETSTSNLPLYKELAWGNNPSNINGLQVDVNSTVSFNSSKDRAVVGNFADLFKWGYAGGDDVNFEVIRYGNPDNNEELGDLRGRNQVLLRCEVFMGFAILDENGFAIIKES